MVDGEISGVDGRGFGSCGVGEMVVVLVFVLVGAVGGCIHVRSLIIMVVIVH